MSNGVESRGNSRTDNGSVGGSNGGAGAGRPVHPLLIALAVIGSLHLFVLLGVEFDRNLVSGREVARLEGDVRALTAELERLEEVAAHGDDLAYREVLARKQGFVYPEESLLVTGRE